jgi:mannosyltransferase
MSTSDYPAPRIGGRRLSGVRLLSRVRALTVEEWAFAAIFIVAAVIRIATINNQSLWADEALTAYEAPLPFGAMINTVLHTETTPPLYFVVIWFWTKVFGTSEVALRAISTIAGIATVAIAYQCARELVSRWAGVVAAALVAVNPYLVWYSQEARSYMLLVALTAAGFLWFIRARDDPSRRNLAWWAALSSLAVMTHFFAGFAVAPEALWLLLKWRERIVWAAVGVVAVAQVAMAPIAIADTSASHGTSWIGSNPLVQRVGQGALQWAMSNVYRRYTKSEGILGAAALVLIVVLLVVVAGDRATRAAVKVGLIVGGFVIVVPIVLALIGHDYWLARNVLPAFIPIVTAIAAACVVPRARTVGAALALVLFVGFSVSTYDVQTTLRLQRPQWRAVARALGPAPVPRAILVSDGTTGDPLKIYLSNVSWVQLHNRKQLVGEIDIVGTRKRLGLLPLQTSNRDALRPPSGSGSGPSLPRSVAPRGTRLVWRGRVFNWFIARYALDHPERLSINQLNRIAPRFFERTPQVLLVFVQRAGR